jgi:ketosteroid isomerase-like protein
MLSYELGEPRVIELDGEAAVVTYPVSFDYNDEQGQRQTVRMYNTNVYARRGKQWQVVFSQMTQLQSND